MENRREFLLTPLREGRPDVTTGTATSPQFLLTPLREGRPRSWTRPVKSASFLLTPLREGRRSKPSPAARPRKYFYSRPCGRGDRLAHRTQPPGRISTHAPAGGATIAGDRIVSSNIAFLLTPLREGRPGPSRLTGSGFGNFYSCPCGRGDVADRDAGAACFQFLLTPLREGRRSLRSCPGIFFHISTHAPAGGATRVVVIRSQLAHISTHAPAGGATALPAKPYAAISISTHAPAGGATFR